jgi:hypothetical protein
MYIYNENRECRVCVFVYSHIDSHMYVCMYVCMYVWIGEPDSGADGETADTHQLQRQGTQFT